MESETLQIPNLHVYRRNIDRKNKK